MKTLYNSIAIALVVLWGFGFFFSSIGLSIHLLLFPIVAILIHDFIGIMKLLYRA